VDTGVKMRQVVRSMVAAAAVSLGGGVGVVVAATPATAAVPAGTILAYADSSGDGGFSGDGGPALSAKVDAAQGMSFDPAGNMLLADTNNNRIRVVAKATGTFYGQAMTAGDIYTIAGTGATGYSGDGGPALGADFNAPQGIAVDAAGDIVVSDTNNNAVRVIAATTGTHYGRSMTADHVYTVAGTGATAYSGDGGPAVDATFDDVQSAIPDGAGNLLIADAHNNVIRVVAEATGTFYGVAMTGGDVYTVAGNGGAFAKSGVPATSEGVDNPTMVSADAAGNLVIDAYLDQRLLVLAARSGTFYGRSMVAGDLYSIAGNGIAGSRNGAASSAEFDYPNTFAIDQSGNVVIADLFNNEVRVLAEATGTFYGNSMTTGQVYTIAGGPTRWSSTGDGGPASAAGTDEPGTVAVDSAGNIFEAEMDEPSPPSAPVPGTQGSSRIREITGTPQAAPPGTPGGLTATAGNGEVALSWSAPTAGGAPTDYVVDRYAGVSATGTPVVADTGSTASSATVSGLTNGQAYTFTVSAKNAVGTGSASTAVTATPTSPTAPSGTISLVAGEGSDGAAGDGGPATAAQLSGPRASVVDAAGDVFIADDGNNRVQVVSAVTGQLFGRSVTAGDVYTLAGSGTSGYSGDGGPAAAAALNAPHGVALDASGNLIIADTSNDRIRVVARTTGTFYGVAMNTGDIYTVAGNGSYGYSGDGGPAASAVFAYPTDVTVDGHGNLVVADFDNDRVRVVAEATATAYGVAMTTGDVYTVAGGGGGGDDSRATAASLSNPIEAVADSNGNLFIADYDNSRVRLVAASTGPVDGIAATAGDIYTLAGNGTYGFSGDGGPAKAAELGNVSGIALDPNGNVVFSDLWNDEIRVVATQSGTFYGVSMTKGYLYDVAGNNSVPDSGNGGPAVRAGVADPAGVTVAPDGAILITERTGDAVRSVSP
jgi:hypothetical protein